ncbi:MAG: UxaA family hydrolase [Actinobacteria bacterium]|nr:UxaA family hydrolase [Actinomycetota bacterium]
MLYREGRVIDYAGVPGETGLVLMGAPGYDTGSTAGLADVADDILGLLGGVLNGELSRAEGNGQSGIACPYVTNPSF